MCTALGSAGRVSRGLWSIALTAGVVAKEGRSYRSTCAGEQTAVMDVMEESMDLRQMTF